MHLLNSSVQPTNQQIEAIGNFPTLEQMISFPGLSNQVITVTTDLDYTTLLYKPTSIIIEERLGWQWSHNHCLIIQGNPKP